MTNEGHGLGEAEEGAMMVRAENWMRFECRGSMAVGERVSDSPKRVRVSGVPRYTTSANVQKCGNGYIGYVRVFSVYIANIRSINVV